MIIPSETTVMLLLLLILCTLESLYSFRLQKLSYSASNLWQTRTITHLDSNVQEAAPFFDALVSVAPKLKHRFFFPGHGGSFHTIASGTKSKTTKLFDALYKFDLPELNELDNIHAPEGPLQEALHLAAELYGAQRTWFLVNGSTSGILIAMLSCIRLHKQRILALQHKRCQDILIGTGAANKTAMCSQENAEKEVDSKSTATSIFLLGRDSHKSAFDALALSEGCDAVLLPCVTENSFQVSLGVTVDSIQAAINCYGDRVSVF